MARIVSYSKFAHSFTRFPRAPITSNRMKTVAKPMKTRLVPQSFKMKTLGRLQLEYFLELTHILSSATGLYRSTGSLHFGKPYNSEECFNEYYGGCDRSLATAPALLYQVQRWGSRLWNQELVIISLWTLRNLKKLNLKFLEASCEIHVH